MGGPTDRLQPRPRRLDRDDAGQDYLDPIVPPWRRCQMNSRRQRPSSTRKRLASGRLELPRPFGHRLLRPTRLPFRHEALTCCDRSAYAFRHAGYCSLRSEIILIDRPELPRGFARSCGADSSSRDAATAWRALLAARAGGRTGAPRPTLARPRDRRGCRDRRGRAGRLCGGAGGAAGRPHRRPDRGDRLDRRPAHLAGRAARRASLDRAVRRATRSYRALRQGSAITTAAITR